MSEHHDHGILLADVFLTRKCNYRCNYCLYGNEPPAGEEVLSSPAGRSALIDFFNRRGRWVIGLTGGEPFVIPEFASFCRSICERHYLALITNLSFPVDDFVESVDPAKVKYIQCSLQAQAEFRIETFLQRCIRLKASGFPLKVAYPAPPVRIPDAPGHRRLFAEHGIDFFIQPFFGMERGRLYPRDYSPEERQLLSEICLRDNFLERYGHLERVSCLVRRDRPTGEKLYRHLASLHVSDLEAFQPDLILVAAANFKSIDAFLRNRASPIGSRIVHYNEMLEYDP